MSKKYSTCQSSKIFMDGQRLSIGKCILPKRHADNCKDKEGRTWDGSRNHQR